MKKILIIIILAFISLSAVHAVEDNNVITHSLEYGEYPLEINNDENINEDILNRNDEYEVPEFEHDFKIWVDENLGNISNDTVTINVNLTIHWSVDEQTYYNILENNNLKVYENDICIQEIPTSQFTLPKFKKVTPITMNTTFKFHINENSKLKVSYKLFYTESDSNTLIFEKLNKQRTINLTNTSISINNKNNINYHSNDTWKNTLSYLNKSIELCDDGGTIKLNNMTVYANNILNNNVSESPLIINKSLTIIGNNLTINALKNPILFNMTQGNIYLINLKFMNTTSYTILNSANLTLINCTFSNLTRAIKNNGNLKIINSTISNIIPIYTNGRLIYLNDYYSDVGVIYNTGKLDITNTKFDNIDSAKEIKIKNKNETTYIFEEGVIYNLNTSNIINSNFTNINGRAINNSGQANIKNNIFENILSNSLSININLDNFTKIDNIIYQSYTGIRPTYKSKTTTLYGQLNLNGSAIYNTGEINITDSYFNKINGLYGGIYNIGNTIILNCQISNSSSRKGGSIYNLGEIIINKTTICESEANGYDDGHGGAIYNEGLIKLNNSLISNSKSSERGFAISNNGIILINNTIIDKNYHLKLRYGSVIENYEDGICNITNSIIKNHYIIGGYPYPMTYMGVLYNEGHMNIHKCVFENNTGPKMDKAEPKTGTLHIYNQGILNATYNLFLNTNHVKAWELMPDKTEPFTFIISGGNNEYIDYNYYCFNTDPYPIDSSVKVNNYFLFKLDEYHGYNINEIGNINATLRLANDEEFYNYNLLPDINVTFTTLDENGDYINVTKTMVNGKISIPYNFTKLKGSYHIFANLGGCVQECIVDVGKVPVIMDLKYENITYENNLTFEIKLSGNYSHPPTGNVSLYINNKKINSTALNNTFCNITLNKPNVGTYNYKIVYEGDEDYFRSYNYGTFNVDKCPTTLNITIPEIEYGETGIIYVTLNPTTTSGKAILYINGEEKSTSIRNGTKIKLNNYDIGEYNITLVFTEKDKYKSSNATAIFKVKKYETSLTINASDINAGESETITVTLTPEGEVAGEATLKINNHTEIIFLSNGANNITVENVTGGTYYIEVYFPGDKKYAPSNATAKFTAKKLQSNITAKIENDILYINTTPNSTGKVQIFINDDIYEENLKNSQIMFQVNFTKAENYIFIYYQGDGYYNYSEASLTYEYEGLLNLTGYDETFYNTENQTYYLTLTNEEGYGIANRTIAITLNNETSNLITGYDGSITYKLNLDAGNYTITAKYRNKTTTNRITVLEDAFITGNDTQAYTNTDFTYQIQLKDHKGNAIANNEITFKINGKTYTNITNNNGIASLNLNLNKGNYNITTQYKTISHTNNIYIGDLILKGNDLTIYNTETGTYRLSLTDKNGLGIANQTITITLNSKTFTRTTDSSGIATLNINLDTGNYTITAQLNDQTITNTITVLEDAFLSVNNTKAYENVDFTHIAKLTDHNGKAIANAEITFKFENKTYTNKTNSEGLAVLTLNLKEGNYTITTVYKNISKTAKIIIADDSHLVGNDVKAYSRTDFTYNVKLTDHNNKGIANAEITFKLEDKTFTNKTDSNGQVALTFNLETGTYTITASYKNRTIENTFEIIEDYILSGNDVKAYSETNFTYKVKLTDHNAKAIPNAEITFKVNGKTYTNKTDVNGQSAIRLSLKTGNYEVTAIYRNTTTTNTFIIIEDYILSGNDVKAYEDDNFQYKVNLTDHNGKAIENQEITFNIDGKTYSNTTNDKGQAILNLNLKEGNYTITAKYRNATTTNELEIIEDHMMIGQNIKAYENTDFTYTVTLKRTDGTPIADKEITFIINNKRYTNITDSEGKASKTLNLPEGNYTITATYKNTKITNNLTIIEEYNLEGNNIRAYAEKDFTYKVNLTDHNKKPVKNAEITFEINGQIIKNKTDNHGQATLNLNLPQGNYTITVTYRNNKLTNKLEIIETYTLKGINVKSYENFDFEYIVTLKNHNNRTIENAEITFIIGNDTYKNKTDNNGKAKLILNLKKGNYTIKATCNNIQTTNKLEIIEYDLERIISEDVEMYYHDGTRFKIQILNQTGPLANKTVQIIINGKPYTRTTDDNGSASIGLNLNSGTYLVTTKYGILEKNNTVTIKSTIKGNDLTKVFRNATQYYATFYNFKGEILKNTNVTFNINGVFYTRTTDENGQAKMNINLPQGTYIITATNPQTQEQHTNIITVLSKIQENNDLTKYYRNASQYTLKIIDSKGNPAKAGQKVTFNINGVFYERYTNETGHVKMNINLPPGTYTITAEYDGCKVSNTINVLPVLKAQDLTMKYRDGSKFKATLLDGEGKPYTNQEVTFNINGVFYTRNTDENGIAKLNINLMPGKYIITSSYNGANIANTVKIE